MPANTTDVACFRIELYCVFTPLIYEFYPNGDIIFEWRRIMATNTLLDGLRERLRRLRSDRRGNVVLTFALALIPIMGAVGAAVDYSRANNIRSQILAAADAASVGSVAKSSPAM